MTLDGVRDLIAPVLSNHRVYQVETVLRGERNSRVLEIFIDAEEGVTSSTCAKVSRDISAALRESNLVAGNYSLVVSSPGIDRPLRLPRQYRRHVGRKLSVIFNDHNGQRTVAGKLAGCSDQGIVVTTEAGTSLDILFENIIEARISLPW